MKHMKKISFIAIQFMLVFPVVSTGYTNASQHQVIIELQQMQPDVNFNTALVQLTESIIPKGFDKSWKTASSVWADKVKSASEVAVLGSSLLELSEQIKPKYFKPAWEKTRDKWVKQVKEARSQLALAGLLKSLYNNLNQEVFSEQWAEKSASWIDYLNKIE
jgi:hypothetical protein